MQVHTNNRWLKTFERLTQKKSQLTHLRFLLPRVGIILFACCIMMITVVQSTYGRIDAVAKNKGTVKLNGDGDNLQATLESLSVSGIPKNANLIIHIHAKNTTSTAVADLCKGPVLFQITDGLQSDAQGKFSLVKGDTKDFVLSSKLTDEQKKALLKASDLDTWLLNIHDADVKAADPTTGEQKPISVACGPLNKNGVATLKINKQNTTKAANQGDNNQGNNNQGDNNQGDNNQGNKGKNQGNKGKNQGNKGKNQGNKNQGDNNQGDNNQGNNNQGKNQGNKGKNQGNNNQGDNNQGDNNQGNNNQGDNNQGNNNQGKNQGNKGKNQGNKGKNQGNNNQGDNNQGNNN